MNKELQEIKDSCENDLKTFARWLYPDRYYGELHDDMFDFIQHGDADSKLLLVSRDHQKSFCMAVATTWMITVDPSVTINYVSYNSDLVEKQLGQIKSALRSERHRMLWPTHLNWVKDRGELIHRSKSGMWQNVKFKIDHPNASKTDPTVRAGTVRGTNTGMHSMVNVFDDVVTDENWRSESDKAETIASYENFSKILSPGGKTYAVGTRYSPDDLYQHIMEEEARWVENGEEKSEVLWEVFQRSVEDSVLMDGSGVFSWPREQQVGGVSYGFNPRELAIKKEKLSKTGLSNFYAQYYNNPNHESTNSLKRGLFKYLNPRHLTETNGTWHYEDEALRIYAYADLAFTDKSSKHAKRRDFTAVVVVGVDSEGYIYVLDMERFQTDKNQVYYDRIIELYSHWGFKSITVETNSAGKFIKKYLEDEVRRQGGRLRVEGKPHVSHEGSKMERIEQTLTPRYLNQTIFHTKGGYTKILEEELVLSRPPHDDLKDALAGAVSLCTAPLKAQKPINKSNVVAISRFGGMRRGRR